MKQLFSILLGGVFLFSCSDIVEQPVAPLAGEPLNVRIKLNATPMQQIGSGTATRGVDNEDAALSVQWRADRTRAESDKTAAEVQIKKAWLLQFSGTTDEATLVSVPQQLTLDADGYSDCQIFGSKDTHRVYVIANVDAGIINRLAEGTTLSTFEGTIFTQNALTVTDVATVGLPMIAYKDFIPSETLPGNFQLISRMAKLTFQYALGEKMPPFSYKAILYGIPDRWICKATEPNADTQLVTDCTYNATYDLTNAKEAAMTLYIPENLAGQNVNIASELQRSTANGIFNSMYIEVTGLGEEVANRIPFSSYVIYLGNIASNIGDFNVQGNCAYNVMVGLKGTNSVADKRVTSDAYLNKSLDAENNPATANCYIISGAGYYYFDATKQGNNKPIEAHTATTVPGDANFNAIVPAEIVPVFTDVIWESSRRAIKRGEIASGVKLHNGKLLFNSVGSVSGNALIAVRNATKGIIWSWHIWRVDEMPQAIPLNDITDGAYYTIKGPSIMNCNLGAVLLENSDGTKTEIYGKGMFYQWGRKEPLPVFGQSTNSVIAFGEVLGGWWASPVATTANPTIYYKYFDSSGDRYAYPRNDNSWGCPLVEEKFVVNGATYNRNVGLKSIYDPCPIGWKVPPAYTLAMVKAENSDWIDTGAGLWALNLFKEGVEGAANTSVLFPQTGSTRYKYFQMDADTPHCARNWTASPAYTSPGNRTFMNFNSGSRGPGSVITQSVSMPVRCVVE